ncbi:MAG TPA: cation diffusion facilitator family transporter [Methylophilaceae bacterium]|jgi:cobalt-zinc-cadmium efflux system protein
MEKTHHHDHKHHSHHAHEDHEHGLRVTTGAALAWPFAITLAFAFVEALGGWYTGSLALLGDAGHMFSDSAGLGLAALGAWMAQKPASKRHSYGLVRAEVVVALINGLLMLGVIAFIAIEAIQRLQNPHLVHGTEVMIIALVGLIVNIVVARQLHQHQHSLNAKAAFLHVMGDMLGSIAAILAGAVIYFTGWMPIDPILSFFISALILFSTINLLREVLHVLMEGVPRHLDLELIKEKMRSVPSVLEVHQIHVWSLSSENIALSAHVVLQDVHAWRPALLTLRSLLQKDFGINHITLQPEIKDMQLASSHFHIEGESSMLAAPH